MADVNITAGADFRRVHREMDSTEQRMERFARRTTKRLERWSRNYSQIVSVGAAAGIGAGAYVIRAAAEDSRELRDALDETGEAWQRLARRLGRDITGTGGGSSGADGLAYLIDGWNAATDRISAVLAEQWTGAMFPWQAATARLEAEADERALDARVRGLEQYRDLDAEILQREAEAFGTEESRARAREAAADRRYRDTVRQINATEDLSDAHRRELIARAESIRDAANAPELVSESDRRLGLAERLRTLAESRYRRSEDPRDERALAARKRLLELERARQRIEGRTTDPAERARMLEEEKTVIEDRYRTELELIERREQMLRRAARDERDNLEVENLRLRGFDRESERLEIQLDTRRRIRDIEAETATTAESRARRIEQLRENERLRLEQVGQGTRRAGAPINTALSLAQQIGRGVGGASKAQPTEQGQRETNRLLQQIHFALTTGAAGFTF